MGTIWLLFTCVNLLAHNVGCDPVKSTGSKYPKYLKWKYFKGMDSVEDAWMKRLKSLDFIEESQVTSFQKDVRYCREELSEEVRLNKWLKSGQTNPFDGKYSYLRAYWSRSTGSWPSSYKHKNLKGDVKPGDGPQWAFVYDNSKLFSGECPTSCPKFPILKQSKMVSWVLIDLPQPMRITGIRVLIKDHELPYDHNKDKESKKVQFPTHIALAYRLYDEDPLEIFLDDEKKEKLFKIPGYETEDDEGFGTLTLDPYITAKTVHIDIRFGHVYYNNEFLKLLGVIRFVLLGCQDDVGMQDFQYSGVDLSVRKTLAGVSDVKPSWPFQEERDAYQQWSHKLAPRFEEGCPIFDFEDGNILNWTVSGGNAFSKQPTHGDNKFYRDKTAGVTGIKGTTIPLLEPYLP